MLRPCLIFLPVIASAGLAFAALGERSVTAHAEWHLSLDASGKIVEMTLKPGRVTEVLRKSLESAVATWEFEPGRVNGVPAATETTLFVEFTATVNPDATGFAVRIDNAGTGGTVRSREKMPRFSSTFDFHSAQAMDNPIVVLDITYDGSGKPERIVPAEGSPIRSGRLVDAAVSAIRTWTFEPERVAGHGIRARALQPVCFDADRDGKRCRWTPPGSAIEMDSRQSVALESQVHLKSNVIGSVL